jgi:DNA polymerase-1
MSLSEKFSPDQIAFAWDSKKSKRKEIYPEYKNNRRKELSEAEKESLELVFEQFNKLQKTILPALGFSNVFHISGLESDDLIASILINQDVRLDQNIVVSSDSDLYQLLDRCSIYSITKSQTMNKEIFMRHYEGITPNQWIIVKAIAGCSTDNVKGIIGIGEKNAIAYLKGTLNKGKRYESIEQGKEITDRNLNLVKLPFLGTPLPKIRKNNLSLDKFNSVCNEYGMVSFLEKKNIIRWEKIISQIV